MACYSVFLTLLCSSAFLLVGGSRLEPDLPSPNCPYGCETESDPVQSDEAPRPDLPAYSLIQFPAEPEPDPEPLSPPPALVALLTPPAFVPYPAPGESSLSGHFSTHSSPPANSFRAYKSAQLFGGEEVGGQTELAGPRRRRRRSPLVKAPRPKVTYVYPTLGAKGVGEQKYAGLGPQTTNAVVADVRPVQEGNNTWQEYFGFELPAKEAAQKHLYPAFQATNAVVQDIEPVPQGRNEDQKKVGFVPLANIGQKKDFGFVPPANNGQKKDFGFVPPANNGQKKDFGFVPPANNGQKKLGFVPPTYNVQKKDFGFVPPAKNGDQKYFGFVPPARSSEPKHFGFVHPGRNGEQKYSDPDPTASNAEQKYSNFALTVNDTQQKYFVPYSPAAAAGLKYFRFVPPGKDSEKKHIGPTPPTSNDDEKYFQPSLRTSAAGQEHVATAPPGSHGEEKYFGFVRPASNFGQENFKPAPVHKYSPDTLKWDSIPQYTEHNPPTTNVLESRPRRNSTEPLKNSFNVGAQNEVEGSNYSPSPSLVSGGQSEHVVLVSGHAVQAPSFPIMMPRSEDPALASLQDRYGSVHYDKRAVQAGLQKAMTTAWAEYGPHKRPPNGYSPSPAPGRGINTRQSPGPPNPNFQPLTSEWDKYMTATPNRNEVLEPGLFNRFLSAYIDFEVNNHEMADLLRKLAFGTLVGLILVGWILLGVGIGFLPYKVLLSGRDAEGKDYEGSIDDVVNPSSRRNNIVREVAESVYLALDGDWLKRLEQTVSKNSSAKWLKTHVQCCILPDASTNGMAECQVLRKARKAPASAFKCLSDLIYNFQFGPADDALPH